MIYEVNDPNLNNNYPNLYNGYQSNITYFSVTNQYWRCDVSSDNKYLYSLNDDDGVYILYLK